LCRFAAGASSPAGAGAVPVLCTAAVSSIAGGAPSTSSLAPAPAARCPVAPGLVGGVLLSELVAADIFSAYVGVCVCVY
jgi:hypothetical protein